MMRVKDRDYLTACLEREGLIQAELARKIQRSPGFVSEVIRGKKNISEADARLVAKVLRTHAWLLFETAPPRSDSRAPITVVA